MIPRADIENPPPFLPPRRPSSLPTLARRSLTWHLSTKSPTSQPIESVQSFAPSRSASTSTRSRSSAKERPFSGSTLKRLAQDDSSRPQSFYSFSSGETATFSESGLQRTSSIGSDKISKHRPKFRGESPAQTPRLEPIRDGEPLRTTSVRGPLGRPLGLTQSSLRHENRLLEDDFDPPLLPPPLLGTSHSDSQLCSWKLRPYSHPSSQIERHETTARQWPVEIDSSLRYGNNDRRHLPAMPLSRSSSPGSQKVLGPRPRPSFTRLSSLDNLVSYREEKAEWKRESRSSSMFDLMHSELVMASRYDESGKPFRRDVETPPSTSEIEVEHAQEPVVAASEPASEKGVPSSPAVRSKFRHFAAEIGFCFTIAMTQFLAEYLISGFAIELPNLLNHSLQVGPGSMGLFWPASLLSLILSATLLIWARLSDMYSAYFTFMFGVAWLAIWTLIPGFCGQTIWLDISRAMQGLAIAAFTPSTFSMVGSIYPEGPRRNFVMGLYSGCAPLGFFAGFLVAGALPEDKPQWYFWIASALAFLTFVTAFLSVPSDRTDRRKLGLKMDWIGSFLIMSGLILVSYALAVEPYANQFGTEKTGFVLPIVSGPFASGIVCLIVAFWYEGWFATCPLLPFDFFRPKGVKPFSMACLCFYASYGVWLYNSAQYLQSPGTSELGDGGHTGIELALWYTPTAIGGIFLCIFGGSLMHIVPIMALLLFSALAWIAAPLLLALAPVPLHYWSYVMPSMLCAAIGIDLTFTVSIVFLSSVQPLRFQGLSGAVCSILVNLAMSFALSISGIVMQRTENAETREENAATWGFRATFIYASASAGLGLLICVLFVRISRSVVQEQPPDEERPRATSSESTLVEDERNSVHDTEESVGLR